MSSLNASENTLCIMAMFIERVEHQHQNTDGDNELHSFYLKRHIKKVARALWWNDEN
jgi:hypothetical protein